MVLARNYGIAYRLDGGVAARNPVLEKMLPSLLHIKMVSILDEALANKIAEDSLPFPKSYRHTLEGRISLARDSGLIKNGDILHVIRKRRNRTAHDISAKVTWDQLDDDILEVHKVLQSLVASGELPNFQVSAERTALQDSEEPGVLFHCDCRIMVKEGDKIAAEIKWRKQTYADSA
jgi:hypothetical protein